MKKEIEDIVYDEYNDINTVELYKDFTDNIGLLDVERYILEKYVNFSDYILDAFCGAGRTAISAFLLGYKNIMAIDICDKMIKAAMDKSKERKCNIDFRCIDFLNLENYKFDAITFWFNSLMVIPEYVNRKLLIKNAYKNLNKEGIVILTTPIIPRNYSYSFESSEYSKCKYDFVFEQGDRIFDKKCYIHFPSDEEIENMFEDFDLIEVDNFENLCSQKGRGYSLACDEKFWIFKKRR